MKNNEFYFCVGDDTKHSSLHKVIIQKDDVYVISRGKNNQMKLSVHASGACQVSLTSEYVGKSKIEIKNQERHLIKRNLLVNPEGYEIAHAIYFPYSELVLEDKILKQNVFWIDAPKINQCVEMLICKSDKLYSDFCFNEWKILHTDILSNRTVILFLYRFRMISKELRDAIEETKIDALKYKETNKIESRMCSTCLFEEHNNIIYEVEVYS